MTPNIKTQLQELRNLLKTTEITLPCEGGIGSYLKNQPPQYEEVMKVAEIAKEISYMTHGCACDLHSSAHEWYDFAIEMEPENPSAYVKLAKITNKKILEPLAHLGPDESEWDMKKIKEIMSKYQEADKQVKLPVKEARKYM